MFRRRSSSSAPPKRGVARIPWRPFGGLLGSAKGDASQSLAALAFSGSTSLITGLTMASITGSFERFPGLLLFIPAAVGLRGNVFGPLGGRLSTSLRTGTFSWTWRRDSVLGQNIVASLTASFVAGLGLAIVAAIVSQFVRGGGVASIGLADYVVVSMFGGILASALVLIITLGLTVASARFGWDLDNVTAPMVSSAGDFVTLPAIVLCTLLIGRGSLTTVLAAVLAVLGVVLLAIVFRSKLVNCKRILVESLPVLVLAGFISLLAGVALEGSVEHLLRFNVLLILVPGFLSTGGALGGVLSSRLATKFHLGMIERSVLPDGEARSDIGLTFALALPIFVFIALVTAFVGSMTGHTSPGFGLLVLVTVTGGLVSTLVVVVVSYYATLGVVRFGLDPDNLGIPLASATLDVVGALALIGAAMVWGVA